MAHTESLGEKTLEIIARQVGDLYPRLANHVELGAGNGELGETFSVWLVTAEDISKEDLPFEKLPQNTGRWHSQIFIGGTARAAARSIPLGGGQEDWSVRQIIEGDVAQAIDEAVEWIDKNVEADPLVRIIEVPSYHITALWLSQDSGDNILVVRRPSTYTDLRYQTLYPGADFLRLLRDAEPIVGIQ